ncbi:class I SAM-dependent methyltransferase [Brachyspira innocens]|uniref:class I SAM-dependent methyltransferase n=1 Tax=Brachyspira innocens TaxID=13264 RepID=UPI0026EA10C9|nr:class I SAM-dependent methyltransferase [Brachyspira innocens]
MNFFELEKFETNYLNDINDILNDRTYNNGNHTVSEMTYKQRCFLNGVIRQTKPKKILEVGVSAGGSSAIILNAINDINNSFLYSIDYANMYYRNKSKKVGFLVNERFSELSNKWKLYTGGVAAKFMEEIGNDIDLCLLDTAHTNPGEFLDILFILPYLKKNAILILHDTAYHSFNPRSYTNGVLFSSLKGKKFTINENYFGAKFGNIGLIILDDDIKERIFDYFYLLTLPWNYMITKDDITISEEFILKHYGENYAKMFLNIALYYQEKINNTKIDAITSKADDLEKQIKDINSKTNNLEKQIKDINSNIDNTDKKINNVINSLAWWIPNRKKREQFRNTMNNNK